MNIPGVLNILLIVSFFGCKTSTKLDAEKNLDKMTSRQEGKNNENHFHIIQSTKRLWTGGVRGVGGINYLIEIKKDSTRNFTFDSLKLGETSLPLEIKETSEKIFLIAAQSYTKNNEAILNQNKKESKPNERVNKGLVDYNKGTLYYHYLNKIHQREIQFKQELSTYP